MCLTVFEMWQRAYRRKKSYLMIAARLQYPNLNLMYGYQGKVYIDDVFTIWNGERSGDFGKSNYCDKWFMLLSVAIVNLVHACTVLILFIYIPLCTVSAYSNKGIFSLQ